MAWILTFFPPLLFVYFYPEGFILALKYAGIFVAILLAILPALMVFKLPKKGFYKSFVGRSLLVMIILIAVGIIALEFLEEAGILRKLIQQYIHHV